MPQGCPFTPTAFALPWQASWHQGRFSSIGLLWFFVLYGQLLLDRRFDLMLMCFHAPLCDHNDCLGEA